MDSKQFAWLYLIENGHAGQTPSYYGGFDVTDARLKKKYKNGISYAETVKLNEMYIKEIRKMGVDWSHTDAPRSALHSRFTDTFHDPEEKEYLEGTLVLKNGEKQSWSAEALGVTNVFDMMAAVSEAPAKFEAIFGKN